MVMQEYVIQCLWLVGGALWHRGIRYIKLWLLVRGISTLLVLVVSWKNVNNENNIEYHHSLIVKMNSFGGLFLQTGPGNAQYIGISCFLAKLRYFRVASSLK